MRLPVADCLPACLPGCATLMLSCLICGGLLDSRHSKARVDNSWWPTEPASKQGVLECQTADKPPGDATGTNRADVGGVRVVQQRLDLILRDLQSEQPARRMRIRQPEQDFNTQMLSAHHVSH